VKMKERQLSPSISAVRCASARLQRVSTRGVRFSVSGLVLERLLFSRAFCHVLPKVSVFTEFNGLLVL